MRIHFTINFLNIFLVLERSQQEHSLYAFISMASMVKSKNNRFFHINRVCYVVVLFFRIYGNEFFVSSSTHLISIFMHCVCYLISLFHPIWLNERMNANEFLFSFWFTCLLCLSSVHTERSNYRRIFCYITKEEENYLHKTWADLNIIECVYTDERIPKNLGQITIYPYVYWI